MLQLFLGVSALFALFFVFGCSKPSVSRQSDTPPRIQIETTNEALLMPATNAPIVQPEVKEIRFERSDPNQFRVGSALNEALRKIKNQAMGDTRGLKLVPSRAVPVLLTEEIRQLDELDLTGRELSDIVCLSQFTHFTSLYLSENRLTHLQPLEKHNNLLALTLDGNQLDDLTPLRGLANLNLVSLDSNKISDVRPLAKLVHLKYLYLGNNRIVNVGSLNSLKNLVALDLSANQLTNLNSLGRLSKLRSLGLFDNKGLKFAEIRELQKALPDCAINHNVEESE